MAQFKEATLTTGEKIIVNVDEIRLMHWIQDATTIRVWVTRRNSRASERLDVPSR